MPGGHDRNVGKRCYGLTIRVSDKWEPCQSVCLDDLIRITPRIEQQPTAPYDRIDVQASVADENG